MRNNFFSSLTTIPFLRIFYNHFRWLLGNHINWYRNVKAPDHRKHARINGLRSSRTLYTKPSSRTEITKECKGVKAIWWYIYLEGSEIVTVVMMTVDIIKSYQILSGRPEGFLVLILLPTRYLQLALLGGIQNIAHNRGRIWYVDRIPLPQAYFWSHPNQLCTLIDRLFAQCLLPLTEW